LEYEFVHDAITGAAKAKFSYGHEVIGPWLEVEIGDDTQKMTDILTAIANIDSGKNNEIMITGREYSVTFSHDDVIVQNNSSINGEAQDMPGELAEDFDDYEQSCSSSCGIEDFRELLLSWAKFTNSLQ